MTEKSKGATFVLVHGAWSDESIYGPVANILRGNGHRVFAPTLTGVGRRAHLLNRDVDLTTHVQDVVNAIKFDGLSDIVLVGHSYGGMVISGIADKIPELISSIVYLDAFLPEDGQSLHDLASGNRQMAEAQQALWDRGEIGIPFPEAFRLEFQIPEKDLWQFTPHPLATIMKPISLTGAYKTIAKKTYVLASKFQGGFQQFYDRLKDDPAWTVVTVPTGHIVQLEAPKRCAEILEAAI
jgi:pimeloyl-ACP methyl ester carboxylesterase